MINATFICNDCDWSSGSKTKDGKKNLRLGAWQEIVGGPRICDGLRITYIMAIGYINIESPTLEDFYEKWVVLPLVSSIEEKSNISKGKT